MPRHRARAQLHRRSVLTLHEVGHHLLSLHRMNNVGLRLRFVYGKNLGCVYLSMRMKLMNSLSVLVPANELQKCQSAPHFRTSVRSLTRRAQAPGSQFGVEQHRAATRTSRSSRHSGRPADQRRLSATEWCNEALYHRASADLSDAAHDDQ